MPIYENGPVQIHYEEAGSGFPLLVIPGGGLKPPYRERGRPDDDLYYFQNEADLPVAMLARMSLSFPILFTTVPLYRRDYTFKSSDEQRKTVKCHFSDGGISSNFPVQFFDQFLPHTPTFGIALNEIDSRRYP